MKKFITILFSGSPLVMTLSFIPKKKLSMDGPWKIVEVQTVKPGGSISSVFPRESLAFFADKYYSFCWSSQLTESHSWQMTGSLKLSRFNQSIINSGTFELKDPVLLTKALFTQNPMFVNGLATFRCSISGDTLILTGLSVSSSDNILDPLYAGGSHIVNKLLKIKSAE
jgi:hypothetical protein